MQYISPLSFLPAGTGTALTAPELKLAKHKLLAEFELTGATTIPIGGKELSRNDVLQLFDQLARANDLAYHALVATDPVLLTFLEKQELEPDQKFSLPEEQVTPEFIEWISPYFSWSFRKATMRMFRDVQPKAFESLVVNPYYMTDQDEWEAWNGVDNFMQLTIRDFVTMNGSKFPSQAAKYTNYDFIWLLCNLPEARFSHVIDKYAFEMMQLSVTVFNKKQRDYAFEILNYARSMRVSDLMRQHLDDKETEMRNILKRNKQAANKKQTWTYIRIAFFVIYVLSRLATCNG